MQNKTTAKWLNVHSNRHRATFVLFFCRLAQNFVISSTNMHVLGLIYLQFLRKKTKNPNDRGRALRASFTHALSGHRFPLYRDASHQMFWIKGNWMYRVFIKYCVFPQNDLIFLNSASSAVALVFYLPLSAHIDTEGNPKSSK